MTVSVPPKGTRGVPFPRFLSRFANRAADRTKTDREIPVVRLRQR
jgi:hypothetical protein